MSAPTVAVASESFWARRLNANCWLTYGSIRVADLCAFMVSGFLAVILRYMFNAEFTPGDWIAFAPTLLIFFFVFSLVGLYPGIGINPIEEFRLILRGTSVVFLLIICGTVLLREGLMASRIVFILAWIFSIVFVPLFRRFVRGWCSLQPWWGIPTVIIGDPDSGLMMLNMLEGHCRLGLKPIALLADREAFHFPSAISNINVFIGHLSDSGTMTTLYPHSYALLTMPSAPSQRIRQVVNEYAGRYRRVMIIPDMPGMTSLTVSAKDICGMLAFEVDQKIMRKFPQLLKRSLDFAIAGALAITGLPVFLGIYLAVRLTSRGPAFYAHERIGRDKRPFRVWKFRTMVVGAEAILQKHLERDPQLREEWAREHKLRKDPRVTAVGGLLRKWSLDELPQLWNVICGDMSLVGPRPIVHSEIEKYGRLFHQYQRVRPGITGLWQISGRNDTTYERRIQIDDYYIRNWSPSLDLYIILRTLKTVCLSEGAY
jgi:Undecaprenyl-phosphate galactose phosphotransferase WbaP